MYIYIYVYIYIYSYCHLYLFIHSFFFDSREISAWLTWEPRSNTSPWGIGETEAEKMQAPPGSVENHRGKSLLTSSEGLPTQPQYTFTGPGRSPKPDTSWLPLPRWCQVIPGHPECQPCGTSQKVQKKRSWFWLSLQNLRNREGESIPRYSEIHRNATNHEDSKYSNPINWM